MTQSCYLYLFCKQKRTSLNLDTV